MARSRANIHLTHQRRTNQGKRSYKLLSRRNIHSNMNYNLLHRLIIDKLHSPFRRVCINLSYFMSSNLGNSTNSCYFRIRVIEQGNSTNSCYFRVRVTEWGNSSSYLLSLSNLGMEKRTVDKHLRRSRLNMLMGTVRDTNC